MPITLPRDLPAYDVLSREGVMVMGKDVAGGSRTSGPCASDFST